MGGRRGSTSLMYEVIMSLLLIALFAAASIGYITRNANGEQYFSKFYSTDVATSADVVNAGYGDVMLRYDNIKPGMNLRFWNENGKVRIGQVTSEVSARTTDYYGLAKTPKLHDFDYPNYLVLKKLQGTFTIQDVDTTIAACPSVSPQVPIEKAIITLTASDATVSAFKDVLKDSPVTYGDNGNIRITVERKAGTTNDLSFSATSLHGTAYACLVQQQMEQVSLVHFSQNPIQTSGTDFFITATITLKADETLSDEQVGRVLALALINYYAAPQANTYGSGILVVGDSITVGYGKFLQQQCPAVQKQLSLSGQSTTWMLNTVKEDLNSNSYGTLVILGGVNDIAGAYSPAAATKTIEQNLQTLIDIGKQKNMRVQLMTILPWKNYPSWTAEKQKATDDVNTWILAHGGYDTNAFMRDDSDRQLLKAVYRGNSLPDGYLHPQPSGYQALASYVKGQLGTVCNK